MTGAFAGLTVSVAALLVTFPTAFVTTTVKTVPESPRTVAAVVNEAAVAPAMSTPFLRHWYVGEGLPIAVTVNVAVCPTTTVVLWGCMVMRGAKRTVRIAGAVAGGLVTLPKAFDTKTEKAAPSSEGVVGAVVNEVARAPGMSMPVVRH